MSVEKKLKDLKINLPDQNPVGAYVAYKITKNLLFISGQISTDTKPYKRKNWKRFKFRTRI